VTQARSFESKRAPDIALAGDSDSLTGILKAHAAESVHPYGAPDDQVTALRAQTLGAVQGFEIYVPPAHTRKSHKLDSASRKALRESEAFLGILNFPPNASDVCREERQIALDNKLMMVQLAEPDGDIQFLLASQNGMEDATIVDIRQRDKTISRIENLLNSSTLDQPVRDRFEGLITTALGLVWSRPQPVASR
jgi:hypothetical protein